MARVRGRAAGRLVYPVGPLLASVRLNVSVFRGTRHGHEHPGGADFTCAAAGEAYGMAGIVDEWPARRVCGFAGSIWSVAGASVGSSRRMHCTVTLRRQLVLISRMPSGACSLRLSCHKSHIPWIALDDQDEMLHNGKFGDFACGIHIIPSNWVQNDLTISAFFGYSLWARR